MRNEILYALTEKLKIIPLLLAETKLPKKEALPACLERLAYQQAFELRNDRWENDLSLVLSRLEEFGMRRSGSRTLRYPTPRVTLKDLSQEELRVALESLPGWAAAISAFPVKSRSRQLN